MYRKLVLSLCLILYSVVLVMAQNDVTDGSGGSSGPGGSDAKTLRGMSVLGNNEAPMSLFIVPWKSSDLGVGTNLHRTLDERDVPVDRDVFMRELEFYQVSVGDKTSVTAAVSQVLN